MPQDFDAMLRVMRRIRGDEYGFDGIVLHEFFQRGIGLGAPANLGHLRTTIRQEIAHRHDLHVGMILKTKCRAEFTNAISNQSDAYLAVRSGLPTG